MTDSFLSSLSELPKVIIGRIIDNTMKIAGAGERMDAIRSRVTNVPRTSIEERARRLAPTIKLKMFDYNALPTYPEDHDEVRSTDAYWPTVRIVDNERQPWGDGLYLGSITMQTLIPTMESLMWKNQFPADPHAQLAKVELKLETRLNLFATGINKSITFSVIYGGYEWEHSINVNVNPSSEFTFIPQMGWRASEDAAQTPPTSFLDITLAMLMRMSEVYVNENSANWKEIIMAAIKSFETGIRNASEAAPVDWRADGMPTVSTMKSIFKQRRARTKKNSTRRSRK